jgi:hypothetical protein
MLLHEDKDLFREVIFSTAADLELPVPIVEKAYYVTMILRCTGLTPLNFTDGSIPGYPPAYRKKEDL